MKLSFEDHVLPRPAERLPDYAHAKSRQTLGERLGEAFKLSAPSAAAIANAVVVPADVRKGIGEPTEPQVEEIPVLGGGTVLGIRTHVWARRVMPDPRNPRIGPSRRHPFAVDPGLEEASRFRPVPEPGAPEGREFDVAELVVDVESRHHLIWASQQAARYVLAENDWRQSIAAQGVLEPIWLVPTEYRHANGDAPVTTLTTVEGSSRMTAVHELLSVNSADIPYEDNDAKLRSHYRKLNELFDKGPSVEDSVALRCERVPALILVGFKRHPASTSGFPTAVRSLVAMRHVDPPKPWGEGPENESLADEVLDELQRRALISQTQHDYYAGSCTRSEAKAAHLSDDPTIRAAAIVGLFASQDSRVKDAIRAAVTNQSTRKRITQKLFNDLATALILRAVAGDPEKADQIRRYMRHAFGKAVHRDAWEATNRDVEQLRTEAIAEVRRAIGSASPTDPGPASLELAIRAAYPLVVSGRLNADRGTANNDQPDRRSPAEVLESMRQSLQGVHQLAQSLLDFAADQAVRAVDETGQPKMLVDGSGYQTVNDFYLRQEFAPAGKVRARRPGTTPSEVLKNRLVDLSEAMDALSSTHKSVATVAGDDGLMLVDTQGVDARLCGEWRQLLSRIGDDLSFWGRTFSRTVGTASVPSIQPDEDDYREEGNQDDDADPYAVPQDEVDA